MTAHAINLKLLDALKGVVTIADRATVEFDAARAAIAEAEAVPPAADDVLMRRIVDREAVDIELAVHDVIMLTWADGFVAAGDEPDDMLASGRQITAAKNRLVVLLDELRERAGRRDAKRST